MSRHFITPNDPRHEVIVGRDAPLGTSFVQVFDTAIDDTAVEAPVAMVGKTLREVHCVDLILQLVAMHALVSEGRLRLARPGSEMTLVERIRSKRPHC